MGGKHGWISAGGLQQIEAAGHRSHPDIFYDFRRRRLRFSEAVTVDSAGYVFWLAILLDEYFPCR